HVVERVLVECGPLQIAGWDLSGDDETLVAMPGEHAAEQLLALALAVGERGVEERAAELDGALERGNGLVVVRAGPAAHAPQAEADFGNGADGAKGARTHLESICRFVGFAGFGGFVGFWCRA